MESQEGSDHDDGGSTADRNTAVAADDALSAAVSSPERAEDNNAADAMASVVSPGASFRAGDPGSVARKLYF